MSHHKDGKVVSCDTFIFIYCQHSIQCKGLGFILLDLMVLMNSRVLMVVPCLTLGYVFTNIHHLTCDNCTVLVTYNNYYNYSHEIEVYLSGYNLTIIGKICQT